MTPSSARFLAVYLACRRSPHIAYTAWPYAMMTAPLSCEYAVQRYHACDLLLHEAGRPYMMGSFLLHLPYLPRLLC